MEETTRAMQERCTVGGSEDHDIIEQIDGVEDSTMHVSFPPHPISRVTTVPYYGPLLIFYNHTKFMQLLVNKPQRLLVMRIAFVRRGLAQNMDQLMHMNCLTDTRFCTRFFGTFQSWRLSKL